jgi:hypothetical protein
MSHFLVVFIGRPMDVYEREDVFGDPLRLLLGENGEISGGGSSYYDDKGKWVEYGCYLDVEVQDLEGGLKTIRDCLIQANAPKSSTVTQFKPRRITHPVYGDYESINVSGRTMEMGNTQSTTEARLQRMEPDPIIHPLLGHMRQHNPDLGYWSGEWKLSEHESIEFVIFGIDEPEKVLTISARDVLDHWKDYLHRLRVFLQIEAAKIADVSADKFTPRTLAFLWKDNPNFFVLEMDLAGDNELWKVHFQNGRPTLLRRDPNR